MGIRFACHVCKKQLNIKRDLAGRRGVCPQCQSRFRIPLEDTEQSTPVDAVRIIQPAAASPAGQGSAAVMAEPKLVARTGVSTSSMTEPETQNVARPETQQPVVSEQQTPQEPEPQQPTPLEPESQHNAPASILEQEPDATWYVRPPSGGQYGPASTDELREWIAQGRVAATALLWRDGWPQWRDAADALPELSGQLPGALGSADRTTGSTVQVESGTTGGKGKNSSISLSGDTSIGAERRSRTMRRISLIAVLVAIAATLIGVLIYAINR